MRYSRPARIILAIIVLAIFGWYEYSWYTNSFMASDLGDPSLKAESAPVEQVEEPMDAGMDMDMDMDMDMAMEEEPAEPTPTMSLVMQMATENAAARGLPAPPDIHISDWQYVLVNGDHPLDPIDYTPEHIVYLNMTGQDTEIVTWYDPYRQQVDELIAQPLIDMTQACLSAGLPVYLSSGYRSYADQAANFDRVNYNNGITDGKDAEGNYITMPAGCSEHQTGLCIDITDRYWEIKNDEIANTPTVQWLAEHCADYGFILRFPKDKRDITHVMGESWHFRYVGVEAARYMTDNNLCLEEFVELYGAA